MVLGLRLDIGLGLGSLIIKNRVRSEAGFRIRLMVMFWVCVYG